MKRKKFSVNPLEFLPGQTGPQTLQDSAVRCTRCNACAQSCPSYLLQREEVFSPRGRVQLLRLICEGKLKAHEHAGLLQKTVSACLLCARCSDACAGNIPVAHQMAALGRALNLRRLARPLHALMRLHGTHPRLFDRTVRLLLFLRRIHLLPALSAFRHAHKILPRRTRPLRSVLKKRGIDAAPHSPAALYLPSLQAAYAEPEIGLRCLQLTGENKTHVLFDASCGLFEYLYGTRGRCLQNAKKLLTRWEKLSSKRPLALLTDSIEIYGFLKNYPSLFAAWPGWQKRAEKMASSVKFVTDWPFPKTCQPAGKAALDASGAPDGAAHAAERARKILKTHFGKNFVECEYSRFPVPAAGLAFADGELTKQTVLENVKDAARRQLQYVYCLSGGAALELDAALRRHYPAAQAKHIIYLLQPGHERI